MPKDPDFLKQFYMDSQTTMRARSETEYKLLSMLVILYPVTITALIAVSQMVTDDRTIVVLGFALAFSVLGITGLVTVKIVTEHTIYRMIGRQVVKVWDYFEMFNMDTYLGDAILDQKARRYGEGLGFLGTLTILWGIALATIGLLAYLAYIKL